jgi:hypothetical protein
MYGYCWVSFTLNLTYLAAKTLPVHFDLPGSPAVENYQQGKNSQR